MHGFAQGMQKGCLSLVNNHFRNDSEISKIVRSTHDTSECMASSALCRAGMLPFSLCSSACCGPISRGLSDKQADEFPGVDRRARAHPMGLRTIGNGRNAAS